MKYANCKTDKKYLQEYFDMSIKQNGNVKIYTKLDHVSTSGMTRYISAFMILDNDLVCIAREVKMSGCGMDMGFHLAYNLFISVYGYDNKEMTYQNNLKHNWI